LERADTKAESASRRRDASQVVGAMGVSGADGEKCAQAAIDAVFKKPASPSAR